VELSEVTRLHRVQGFMGRYPGSEGESEKYIQDLRGVWCVTQDPKAKILDCCGIDRHVNACLNLLKTQYETLRFSVDRFARVAMTSPLNKARSQSEEATLKMAIDRKGSRTSPMYQQTSSIVGNKLVWRDAGTTR
jgi:hypothetical protein